MRNYYEKESYSLFLCGAPEQECFLMADPPDRKNNEREGKPAL